VSADLWDGLPREHNGDCCEEGCPDEDWDCGSGMCDPNTGCPACADAPAGGWVRRA
jgi:hypothetical protein